MSLVDGNFTLAPTKAFTEAPTVAPGIFGFFRVPTEEGYFLKTFEELWLHLICWSMFGCGLGFFAAGVLSCRVTKMGNHKWLWVPPSMLVLGAAVGFVEGAIFSAIISAMYTSIGEEVGLDVATGLGLGQAIIIMYAHLGRADFMHT